MLLFRAFWSCRRWVTMLVLLSFLVHSLGCGTILHPDRVGQPHRGRIDPAIAVLDGVGLLLFIVPGVFAFIVDFATGAIYLPPEGYGQTENEPLDPSQCQVIHVPPEELTHDKLEAVLGERTGKSIELKPGSYDVQRLNEDESKSLTVLGQSE